MVKERNPSFSPSICCFYSALNQGEAVSSCPLCLKGPVLSLFTPPYSFLPLAWRSDCDFTLLFSAGSASVRATHNHSEQSKFTVNLLWSHTDHMLYCWDTSPSGQLGLWAQIVDFTHFPDKYHWIRFVSVFAFELVCWFRWPFLVLSVSAFCIGMSSVFSSREGRAEQRGGELQWFIFFSTPPCGFQTFMSPPKSIPCGSAGKDSACNAGDLGSIPGLERSLEKGKAIHSGIIAWRISWTI